MAVSPAQCRLAYLIILMNVAVCRAFGRIVGVLVAAFKSDQITVRARSLKSVTQMLERDPSLIDRTPQINHVLLRCVVDQSAMVRDSALALLGKCITFKASVDPDMLKSILASTRDLNLGVKKRALKLLKEIYLRESGKGERGTKELKVVISESLLQRVDDVEESISEMARETLQDIWMSPFWALVKLSDLSVHDKIALKVHMDLIIQTIERNEINSSELRKFLKYTMSEKCKAHEANVKVNRALVIVGFESMIDSVDDPGSASQRSILQTLTIYAQANPWLFSQQQLEYLKPYIGNLSGADDLNLFRRVVVILRCVLPTLPTVQKEFLKGIQDDLFRNVAKLAKAELNEVAACLWTINGVLENVNRLVNLEVSVLNNLHQMETVRFEAPGGPKDPISKAQRFIYLAGTFGHHCDFQPELEHFRARLTWLHASTVPGKIVAALKPFFKDVQPLSLRTVAMEGMGMVCQAWPQNFSDQSNVDMFRKVLSHDHRDLQKIVLACFRNFFASQDPQFLLDERSEEKAVLVDGKIGGSVIASEKDGAAALIAQGFSQDVIRISLGSQDDYALAATEVMASIVRQGLVHPKDCGPALVALTTSANPRIAAIALQQHQTLHLQHESMFEREYMRAIHLAYQYQKKVSEDTRGFARPTFRAKLHSMYEVIKTSKSKVQTKFLSNYCSKIDFDLAKLDVSEEVPAHLDYARFLIENLALFDYGRMEDLLHVISTSEKIVSNTGSAVAHGINTDVFKMIIDPETGVPLNASADQDKVNIDVSPARLKLLTTASMVLSMLWQARTFIRRLYNINNKENKKEGRGRPSKDQTKIPPKNNLIGGEKIVDAIDNISNALDSREQSLRQCKEFAELMAIDLELKVADDGDEEEEARLRTPSVDGEEESMADPNSAIKFGKRKSSVSLNGTPAKKKRGRPSLHGARKNSKKSMNDDEDDWD
ncbi:MAG: hypothetical protein LQ340_002212 [Diploschistes diacapsis]|nr:MAG: hypothetical protein LQ340_002212 [Diploschistes diacapsis]